MTKKELNEKMSAILVANNIELSSELAKALLSITVSNASGAKKDFLPILVDNASLALELINNYLKGNAEVSLSDIEKELINYDVKFEVLDTVNEPTRYVDPNILAYCIWFKEYRPIGQFSISKRNAIGLHYECKEAEINWAHYGKLIKDLDEEIDQIKMAVMDEIYTPSEGKEKIKEVEDKKIQFEQDRKNKVTILHDIEEIKKWKSKELYAHFYNISLDDIKDVQDSQETQETQETQEVQEVQEQPKKARKKK